MTVTVEIELNGVRVPVTLDAAALNALAAAITEQMPQTEPPEWMSAAKLATYLDCTVERIHKLVARRRIPFHQEAAGCKLTFKRTEIDEWLTNT